MRLFGFAFRFLPLLALGVAGVASAADDASLFLWRQANAAMATASAPADFAKAAEVYRQLLDRGVRTAPVFYNYGTALLLAESPVGASDALLRAERLAGSSDDIRRNLLLAYRLEARLADNSKPEASPEAAGDAPAAEAVVFENAALPWYRAPLGFHYGLPLARRTAIALVALQFVWLAILLAPTRLRTFARGLLAVSLVVAALFGTSALCSHHQNAAPLPEPVFNAAP